MVKCLIETAEIKRPLHILEVTGNSLMDVVNKGINELCDRHGVSIVESSGILGPNVQLTIVYDIPGEEDDFVGENFV